MPTAAQKTKVLLAARPGLWRNALETLLRAKPELEVFSEVNDLGEIYLNLSEQAPQSLILEAALCGNQLPQTIQRITAGYQNLNLVIIADSTSEIETIEALGAGRALLKSMLHNDLTMHLLHVKPAA